MFNANIAWLFVLALSVATADTGPAFNRYEVILQRRPFAMATPAEDPTPPRPAIEPEVFKHFRMCAITSDGETLCVGLIDDQPKPPKSYLLGIGESEDGITLLEANYEQESALVRKGESETWLRMGPGDSVMSPAAPNEAKTKLAISMAQRMRQRREAVRKRLDARLAEEAKNMPLEQKLRGIQMDRIRQGRKPLAIPLSQEMDDQLVVEGALPPQRTEAEEAMPVEEESL